MNEAHTQDKWSNYRWNICAYTHRSLCTIFNPYSGALPFRNEPLANDDGFSDVTTCEVYCEQDCQSLVSSNSISAYDSSWHLLACPLSFSFILKTSNYFNFDFFLTFSSILPLTEHLSLRSPIHSG